MSPTKLNRPAPRGSHRAKPHAPEPDAPESLWSRYTKTRNWLIGVASAVVTLAAASAVIAPYAEAVTPVTHSYYRTVVLPRVITAQLDVNQERRERLLGETKRRELELKSPDAANTPQYKALVQEQIDRAAADLKNLDKNDESLFKEQGKTR
jgi:hypothetical protein